MFNKIKFIAFDFDGVIADSRQLAIENINIISNEYFPQLPFIKNQNDLAMLFSGPLKTSLRRYGLTDIESDKFFKLHSMEMLKSSQEIKVFNKVIECIQLIPNTQIAIVTSAYSAGVKEILNRESEYFHDNKIAIFGKELKISKAEKFKIITSNENLKKTELLKIGDMVSDILHAKEFGIPVGVTGWGYHPLSYLQVFQPDYSFKDPDNLFDFISDSFKK